MRGAVVEGGGLASRLRERTRESSLPPWFCGAFQEERSLLSSRVGGEEGGVPGLYKVNAPPSTGFFLLLGLRRPGVQLQARNCGSGRPQRQSPETALGRRQCSENTIPSPILLGRDSGHIPRGSRPSLSLFSGPGALWGAVTQPIRGTGRDGDGDGGAGARVEEPEKTEAQLLSQAQPSPFPACAEAACVTLSLNSVLWRLAASPAGWTFGLWGSGPPLPVLLAQMQVAEKRLASGRKKAAGLGWGLGGSSSG